MAVDSGMHTPETIRRRQKIAEMLLGDSMKQKPIHHWAQGLAQMAQAGMGGYLGYRANEDEAASRKEAIAQALAAFGGGGEAPGSPMSLAAPNPGPVASPPAAQAAPTAPAPPPGSPSAVVADTFNAISPPPQQPQEAGSIPFRKFSVADVQGAVSGDKPDVPANWTPKDIERARGVNPILLSTAARAAAAGGVPFTPGVMGGVRDQATQDKLVAQGFSKTRNSNHLGGRAIDLWPEGNPNAPTEKYAQIAEALKGAAAQGGVPLNWGGDWKGAWDKPHFEMGGPRNRPPPFGVAYGGPAATASDAPPIGIPPGGPGIPAAAPPQAAPQESITPPPATAPVQVAQNAPASPGMVPAAPPQSNKAAIAAMLNPWTPPAMAAALAGQINPSYGFQTLPDGTILRTDPKRGTVAPIYKAETKPTFGVIGEDQFGNKIHGWIDPYKQTTSPAQTPPGAAPGAPITITGPDGKQIEVPAGQDPKKFREHITTATADARAGKLTEVQANATQYANRMEDAEKNFTGLEGQAGGVGGAAQQIAGKVPVVGSALQTKNYQKFEQAKSQFITALLRKESGAAIGAGEFNRYDKEFFPQPGDAPEVITQKANARKVAIEAMKKGAGPIYESPKTSAPPSAADRKSIGGKNYIKQNGQWFEE